MWMLVQKAKDNDVKKIAASLLLNAVIVFLFFGLAATKVTSHVFIAAMPIFLGLGIVGAEVLGWVKPFLRNIILFQGIKGAAVACIITLSLFETLDQLPTFSHPEEGGYISKFKERKAIFQSWAKTLPANAVVFNVPKYVYIDAMYYAPNVTAYPYIPDSARWAQAVQSGRPLFIAKPHIGHPKYVYETKGVVFLNDSIPNE
jgi:hypothetical protein